MWAGLKTASPVLQPPADSACLSSYRAWCWEVQTGIGTARKIKFKLALEQGFTIQMPQELIDQA
jgi:hypothetical protein